MARPSEEISKYNANSNGKTDANLANDSLHLGGIPAEEYATERYVQDYHDNKEEQLRQDMAAQDNAKLQEAKAYTDTMIANQDFSHFAKDTDLQTLNTNLSGQIQQCGDNCQNRINTAIAGVVSDVNANFDDVNSAIAQLNQTDQQLFQSVSNGKSTVAAAITDMGVNTASDASFSTMASNIRQIEVSHEDDPNYVNTSDANALASDIANGKTAYVKGQKVYGNHIDYPTYGTDTTNATINAEDVVIGKTAYAGGQLIVGTYNPESPVDAVDEVYGLSSDPYNYNSALRHMGVTALENITSETVNPESLTITRMNMAFSKDLNYCVCESRLYGFESDTDYYIESLKVTDNGFAVSSSSGENGNISKKYRYTKAELGIPDDEKVLGIALGAPGFLGYSTTCLLIIETQNSSNNRFLNLFTYHMNDNGVIGKEYTNQKWQITGFRKQVSQVHNIATADTNPNIFFLRNSSSMFVDEVFTVLNQDETMNIEIITKDSTGKMPPVNNWSNGYSAIGFKSINNDKYLVDVCPRGRGGEGLVTIVGLSEDFKIKSRIQYSKYSMLYIDSIDKNLSTDYSSILISDRDGEYYTGTISRPTVYRYKNITPSSPPYNLGFSLITPDESKLILLRDRGSYDSMEQKNLYMEVYSMQDILAEGSSNVSPIQSQWLDFYGFAYNSTSSLIHIASNQSGNKIVVWSNGYVNWNSNHTSYSNVSTGNIWVLTTNLSQDLAGVFYKGQFFRASNSGLMSATPSDVASGKTFIGYNGTVETGTASTTQGGE